MSLHPHEGRGRAKVFRENRRLSFGSKRTGAPPSRDLAEIKRFFISVKQRTFPVLFQIRRETLLPRVAILPQLFQMNVIP